jgi:hypothetical protein
MLCRGADRSVGRSGGNNCCIVSTPAHDNRVPKREAGKIEKKDNLIMRLTNDKLLTCHDETLLLIISLNRAPKSRRSGTGAAESH